MIEKPNILIVEARFYTHISDALLDGATAALEKADAHFERLAVPGALEIPPGHRHRRAFGRAWRARL